MPKESQDNKITAIDVKKAIDLANLSVGVQKMHKTSNGGLLLQCNDAESAFKVMNESKNKLGDKYNIRPPLRKKLLKIVGIDTDECSDKETVQKKIYSQNKFSEKDVISVLNILHKEDNTSTVTIEVKEDTCDKICDRSRLYIGFDHCIVYEIKNKVARCYKCSGYGHYAQVCRNKAACPKCSESHSVTDCRANEPEFKCINCITQNNKAGLSLDINHPSWSSNCEVYQNKLKRLTNRNDK